MPTTLVTPGAYEVLADLVNPPIQDFTCEISSYDLQAAPQTIAIPASFCANGYNDVGSVQRSLVLTVLCDWEDPASLAWFLNDNAGMEGYVKVVKSPAATGLPGFTAHVRFVSPSVTLATGTAAVATVTMPVFDVTFDKPTGTTTVAASAPKTPATASA